MAVELEDEILTAAQVAKLLKVTRRKVMRELRRRGPNQLPSFKVGRDIRFWQSEVLDWARRQPGGPEEEDDRPKPPKKGPSVSRKRSG